jgi:hypothetical protein
MGNRCGPTAALLQLCRDGRTFPSEIKKKKDPAERQSIPQCERCIRGAEVLRTAPGSLPDFKLYTQLFLFGKPVNGTQYRLVMDANVPMSQLFCHRSAK